jgi:hypothetical protein
MLKYSLVLLGAIALFVGCDGDCCQEGKAVVVSENVKPVVTRVLGEVGNATVTCIPGNTRNLSANGSDTNGNLDTNTYSYTVDGVTNTTGTVTCPADGETKRVCATVKDEEGLVSDEVCVNVKGVADPVTVTCSPAITATDDITGNVVDAFTAGDNYSFDNNVTAENCPNVQCTWSVKSFRADDTFYTCMINNSHIGTDDEANPSPHVTLGANSANIAIRTCANNYARVVIDLSCTDSTLNKTKSYDLQ